MRSSAAQRRQRNPAQPVFRTGIKLRPASTSSSPTRTAPTSPISSSRNFEVTEDGKPQAIENFKFIKSTATGAQRRRPGAPDPHGLRRRAGGRARRLRCSAIFFDDYHVGRRTSSASAAASTVHPDAARADGHDRPDVSARAVSACG